MNKLKKPIDRAQINTDRGANLRKHNEVNRVIARKILNLRRKLGLTRTEIAEKIGVSQQQLAKYESNNSVISIGRLLLISKALGSDLDYFFQGFESESTVAENESFGLDFLELSNKHKEGINFLVRSMVG